MPTSVYTVETSSGKRLKIEAPDEASALQAADDWELQNAQASQGSPLKQRLDDDANSIRSGVTSGALELAGMFGNARDTSRNVVDWGAQKLGASPETAGQIANASQYLNPLTAFAPSGEQLKQITNFQPHQSQTPEGPYLHTMGEMGAGMIAGPGSVGRNLLSGVTAGAMTEGAGQLAHKFAPEWEPQVRWGTAVVSSILSGMGAKNIKELSTAGKKKVADDLFKQADANGEVIAPEVFEEILSRTGLAGYDKGLRPRRTPQSFAGLEYADEYSGKPVPVRELQKVRELLKASGSDAERTASGAMVREFDKALDEKAINTHADARKAWADYKRSQTVDKLNKKIDRKAAKFSLSGKENATRDVYRTLADNENKMRYFDQATTDAIDRVSKGGPVENAARMGGKFAPTGPIPVIAAFQAGAGDLSTAATLMAPGAVSRLIASGLTAKNRRLAEALMKHGGEEGLKLFKQAKDEHSRELLVRALLSGEASQGSAR